METMYTPIILTGAVLNSDIHAFSSGGVVRPSNDVQLEEGG